MNPARTIATRRIDIDELDKAIVNIAARINAATYELLTLIREFDERAGWLKWGLSSCTEWLHWRCDLSLSAARDKVRVAHALKYLPEISDAFAKGQMSYSKVRALTRVATVLNELTLLDFAMTTTAARVEERVRQLRNAQPGAVAEGNRVYQNRSLLVWRNVGRGTMTITVELPIEQGELIDQALSKAMEDQPANGPEFESESFSAQQADALVSVANAYLRGNIAARSGSADAYQVVVHVDESALSGGEGRSDLPVEAVKRLSCDASIVPMVVNNNGEPLSVGRKQRTVTTAIKRALLARDGGCSYPGCTHRRYVDAHHVRHWVDGGETGVDNLVMLCTTHHRFVHEGGYEMHKNLHGEWYFRRPDGRAVPNCGYHPDDMIDDDIYPEEPASASAEVSSIPTHQDNRACAEGSPILTNQAHRASADAYSIPDHDSNGTSSDESCASAEAFDQIREPRAVYTYAVAA